ncbi:MAG: hypothetical protein IIC84_04400 [Chloroflexi bacterium]|nr:hypothetical protein [Chloroflexota bacterium]
MVDKKARYERRQGAQARRQKESRKARLGNFGRVLMTLAGGLAVVAVISGGLYLWAINQKELPPTEFGPNHLESFPPQQINTLPVPRLIQEHVMERGGDHRTGSMLVQYNCVEYECEPDTPGMLAEIVRDYPENVFLAPYPDMDAQIALTAPGRRLLLDTLDEGKIREFLSTNLSR